MLKPGARRAFFSSKKQKLSKHHKTHYYKKYHNSFKLTRRTRHRMSKRRMSKCKKYLQKKIKINMHEYKKGRFVSRKQALAVSYSQTRKKYPRCKF